MNQNEKKAFLGGLLIGAFTGAIVSGISALLMAPYSGEATRQLLRTKGNAFKADAERRVMDAVMEVEDSLGRANQVIEDWKKQSDERLKTIQKPSKMAGRVVEKVLE